MHYEHTPGRSGTALAQLVCAGLSPGFSRPGVLSPLLLPLPKRSIRAPLDALDSSALRRVGGVDHHHFFTWRLHLGARGPGVFWSASDAGRGAGLSLPACLHARAAPADEVGGVCPCSHHPCLHPFPPPPPFFLSFSPSFTHSHHHHFYSCFNSAYPVRDCHRHLSLAPLGYFPHHHPHP